MDKHKIDNFLSEHNKGEFPFWRSASPEEICKQIKNLRKAYNLASTVPQELMLKIYRMSNQICGKLATDEKFDLSNIMLVQNPNSDVYINWDYWSTVDVMQWGDLVQYFEYIWYPQADDMDISDETGNWVIFVEHSGLIRVALS
jgi:hypothetical protein